MKKYILIVLIIILFTGCISLVSDNDLKFWALSNGFILASDCPTIPEAPPRTAQPHPNVPIIQMYDSEGNYIPITEDYLMKIIILLFGTVEKYQYLAEIYEREYLNADGKIMPDLTLEELKTLYLERVSAIENITPTIVEPEEETTEGEYPTLGASTSTPDITVTEFVNIVEAFNYFQNTGKQ